MEPQLAFSPDSDKPYGITLYEGNQPIFLWYADPKQRNRKMREVKEGIR